MDQPLRIGLLLADGHPIVLQGMQDLFRREADLEVLAHCTSESETLSAVERHRSAILVLDLCLPGRGGLELLANVAARHPLPKTILVAGSITANELARALRIGVKGLVLKDMPPASLLNCIRHVSKGERWMETVSVSALVDQRFRREMNLQDLERRLTRRELQIMQLAATGLRNRDITERLQITEGTVKVHLHNIYTKLKLRDRLQLVCRARDMALV